MIYITKIDDDENVIDVIYQSDNFDDIVKYIVYTPVLQDGSNGFHELNYDGIISQYFTIWGVYHFGNGRFVAINMSFDFYSKLTGNEFDDDVFLKNINMCEGVKRILRDNTIKKLGI